MRALFLQSARNVLIDRGDSWENFSLGSDYEKIPLLTAATFRRDYRGFADFPRGVPPLFPKLAGLPLGGLVDPAAPAMGQMEVDATEVVLHA